MSERKAQAIYDAVHEAIMELRVLVAIRKTPPTDGEIATAQGRAASAAVEAYQKKSTRKASQGSRR